MMSHRSNRVLEIIVFGAALGGSGADQRKQALLGFSLNLIPLGSGVNFKIE